MNRGARIINLPAAITTILLRKFIDGRRNMLQNNRLLPRTFWVFETFTIGNSNVFCLFIVGATIFYIVKKFNVLGRLNRRLTWHSRDGNARINNTNGGSIARRPKLKIISSWKNFRENKVFSYLRHCQFVKRSNDTSIQTNHAASEARHHLMNSMIPTGLNMSASLLALNNHLQEQQDVHQLRNAEPDLIFHSSMNEQDDVAINRSEINLIVPEKEPSLDTIQLISAESSVSSAPEISQICVDDEKYNVPVENGEDADLGVYTPSVIREMLPSGIDISDFNLPEMKSTPPESESRDSSTEKRLLIRASKPPFKGEGRQIPRSTTRSGRAYGKM